MKTTNLVNNFLLAYHASLFQTSNLQQTLKFIACSLYLSLSLSFVLSLTLTNNRAFAETNIQKQGKVIGGKHTEYPAWFKESFLELGEDLTDAKDENKQLMLLFSQENCPYCYALVSNNLSQKSIYKKIQDNFDVVHLNLKGDREVVFTDNKTRTEKDLAKFLKVQFTPTILFFDANSKSKDKIIFRLNGYIPPSQFNLAIDYLIYIKQHKLDNKANNMTYRDYLAKFPNKSKKRKKYKSIYFKTVKNIDAAAKKQPKVILFGQRDCPDCETLEQQISKNSDLKYHVQKLASFNLDSWSNKPITVFNEKTTPVAFANKLKIQYTPTLIFFDENNNEIIRIDNQLGSFHLASVVDYVASKAYKTYPKFQDYIGVRSEQLRAQGIDVDLSIDK